MRRAALRLQRERTAEAQAELLEDMSTRWIRAQRMRNFLVELEARIPPESRSPTVTAWFDWARNCIDELDPLLSRGVADLLRNAEVLAPDPVDDEQRDEEEQLSRDTGMLDELEGSATFVS